MRIERSQQSVKFSPVLCSTYAQKFLMRYWHCCYYWTNKAIIYKNWWQNGNENTPRHVPWRSSGPYGLLFQCSSSTSVVSTDVCIATQLVYGTICQQPRPNRPEITASSLYVRWTNTGNETLTRLFPYPYIGMVKYTQMWSPSVLSMSPSFTDHPTHHQSYIRRPSSGARAFF